MKKVFLLYIKDKYPECHAPDRNLNSVWSSKRELNKALKIAEKEWPILYSKENIEIEEVKTNKLYTL